MNIPNSFLKRLLARWSTPAVTSSDPPPVEVPEVPWVAPPVAPMPPLDRLEVQAIIIGHLEWCVQFNERLSRERDPNRSPTSLPGAADSDLGRWLAQLQESTQQQHPVLADLEREHQRFHELADKALSLAGAGHMHLASTLLNTDFERSRARLLDLLRSLQRA